MTLNDAIKHCYEVSNTCDNKACSRDHRQLAGWLEELKRRREGHQHGYWIELDGRACECSVCHSVADGEAYEVFNDYNFCPYCGAELDEEVDYE